MLRSQEHFYSCLGKMVLLFYSVMMSYRVIIREIPRNMLHSIRAGIILMR